MPTFVLYDPSESSHVDATTMVTHDAIIYEGDHDGDSTLGEERLGAESNPFASGGVAGTNLGIGKGPLGSGANTKKMRSLFRITLPEGPKASPTGEIIGDANAKIQKIVLKFKSHSISGTGGGAIQGIIRPVIRPPSSLNYTYISWLNFSLDNTWSSAGLSTGDFDMTTDYGTGTLGVVAFAPMTDTSWNSATIQDNTITGPNSATTLGLDWGKTVDLCLLHASGSYYDTTNNYSRIYGLEVSTANLKPYVEVHYTDDKPTKPEISISALEDFRQAKISFTKRPSDEDLTQYVMSWRQGGVPTYQTGASAPSYGKALTDTGKETYHGWNDLYHGASSSSTFFPGGTTVAGTANQLTIWAEDTNNTGASGATKGNTISLTRYKPYSAEDITTANFAKSSSCSWISIGKHTGSNNASVLTDATSGTTTPWLRGNFIANGVEVGDKVYNVTDRDSSTPGVATITAVTDTTLTGTLADGTDDDWDTNDVYVVVRKVDVGEKVSITVRSTRVDGLQFDKIGVNWTNTGAGHISDFPNLTLEDFDIIELDAPTTEHTISYRYSEPGTYHPNFFFVDTATGFRTLIREIGLASTASSSSYVLDVDVYPGIVVEQAKPIPRLTSSKSIGESANVALDKDSAVIYSGANSTAVGSDAYVKSYKWLGEYASGQILTQGCLDINNTPLINESKKLYMRCNTANYQASVFTIYGLASFRDDNTTPIKDSDATFSHYRYVKATVSPGSAKYLTYNTADTHSTGGASPVAAVLSGTAEQMYFKQVDFIYCTTKSGTSGTEECYQLLAADSDNDGTIDVAGTLDTSTVCKRLVIDSNNGSPGYKWGGYCSVTGSSNITFTKESGADEIESTAIDFITAGFGPGDTITVENTSNDGVYTIQKIEYAGSKYSMYLNEEFAMTEASTSATIYTTQPSISVAAKQAGSPKISLNVTDNLATSGEAPVNIYTTFRDQTYLDLNATADSGNIAIQNASLTRSGGIGAAMPLGERRYPPGAIHTKHGLPKMSMTVRVVDTTGFNRMYRLLNNSYNYAVYQHHDTSFASWVKYRLKLESFTVNRDPQNLQHQVIDMTFFIVGEEV